MFLIPIAAYAEYSSFFGHSDGEYWIGLEAMHSLTTFSGRTTWRFEMVTKSGKELFMEYKDVTVAGNEDKYRINIGVKTKGNAWEKFR